jgi:hypothetical protein
MEDAHLKPQVPQFIRQIRGNALPILCPGKWIDADQHAARVVGNSAQRSQWVTSWARASTWSLPLPNFAKFKFATCDKLISKFAQRGREMLAHNQAVRQTALLDIAFRCITSRLRISPLLLRNATRARGRNSKGSKPLKYHVNRIVASSYI